MNQPCVRSGPGRADQSPRTLRAVAGQDSVGAAGGEVLIGLARLAEPWAVRVAATLRLADLAADGGTGLEALATRAGADPEGPGLPAALPDRKSTRLNSSHVEISYAVFCLKKKKKKHNIHLTTKKKQKQTPP